MLITQKVNSLVRRVTGILHDKSQHAWSRWWWWLRWWNSDYVGNSTAAVRWYTHRSENGRWCLCWRRWQGIQSHRPPALNHRVSCRSSLLRPTYDRCCHARIRHAINKNARKTHRGRKFLKMENAVQNEGSWKMQRCIFRSQLCLLHFPFSNFVSMYFWVPHFFSNYVYTSEHRAVLSKACRLKTVHSGRACYLRSN